MIQSDLNDRCSGISYIYWSQIFITNTKVFLYEGDQVIVLRFYCQNFLNSCSRNSSIILLALNNKKTWFSSFLSSVFYCPVVSCSFQSSLCYKDLLSGFKWGLFADDKLGKEGGTLKREAFCVPALLTSSATAVQKPEKFTPNRQHWGFFLFFTPLAAQTVVEIIYLGEVLEKISVFFLSWSPGNGVGCGGCSQRGHQHSGNTRSV